MAQKKLEKIIVSGDVIYRYRDVVQFFYVCHATLPFIKPRQAVGILPRLAVEPSRSWR